MKKPHARRLIHPGSCKRTEEKMNENLHNVNSEGKGSENYLDNDINDYDIDIDLDAENVNDIQLDNQLYNVHIAKL